jgi:malonyl-CoA O-methyltransferase
MTVWKDSILRRFDAAAATYDRVAGTQRRIAAGLARRILALAPAVRPEVLEIGCGTGALTAVLGPRLPGCRWLATDLSPRMVAACARRTGTWATLRVMDGECPDLPERSFDLIVSNLAVQWFGDLPAGLARLHGLLKPGGVLAATTLGAGTFKEWRSVCRAAGVEPATPPYPTAEALGAALAGSTVHREPSLLACGDLKGFLDHLRLSGARTAAPGHPGLSPAALGRMLRAWGANPFTATYEVLTVIWRKEP